MIKGQITTDVELATRVLVDGGVIGMPTETVYGLAAMARTERAVHRVFDIKQRPRHHPLIVHVASTTHASEWGRFNSVARALAEAFWPGPLTLLVPGTQRVAPWVTGGRDTVAIRIPSHPLTLELLSRADDGVVAPSANRFGKVSPTTAQHVAQDLGPDVDLILDGGACSVGLESTIVECVGANLQLLRPGAITAAQILETTGLTVIGADGESRAPGMLLSHYAPNTAMHLCESIEEALSLEATLMGQGKSVLILHRDDDYELAVSMYDEMRRADLSGMDAIVAVLPADSGIGTAIRDRLRKAAADR